MPVITKFDPSWRHPNPTMTAMSHTYHRTCNAGQPMLTRRDIVACAAAALAAPAALAQSPSMATARVIVGFPPGGASDVIARTVSEQTKGQYASTLIVENKPGAAARIAAELVKASAPDGTTMLVTPASVLTLYPHVYKGLRYDAFKDFAPVTAVSKTDLAMFAGPAVPASVQTVAELIRWLKANPKLASFGTPALGASPHLAGLMFARLAGVEMTVIPYQGGAPAAAALIGGEVPLTFGSISDGIEHAKAGKVRVLSTTGAQRSSHLPSVPTFAESGFPDLVIQDWHTFVLPGGTPPAVVERLNTAVRAAIATPVVQGVLNRFALESAGNSVEDFTRVLRSEHERWARIVATLKFTME
jgi:tripartite-type tricarboxylate transporter receptor subunit TctC